MTGPNITIPTSPKASESMAKLLDLKAKQNCRHEKDNSWFGKFVFHDLFENAFTFVMVIV